MHGCRIGVGRADLTPTEPGPVCGWGPPGTKRATPPADRRQRLVVTALALEDAAGERVVLVNADLHCGGPRLWQAAAEAAGLDRSRVVVSGTHTHAGPGQRYGGRWYAFATSNPTEIEASTRRLAGQVAEAVREALWSLAPGGVSMARVPVLGAGSNRAAPAWAHYDDEQRAAFEGSGPGAAVADAEHVADRWRDPRLTALVASSDDGTARGVLAWYAIHGGSLGPRWPSFGADLWGPARVEAEAELPGAVVGLAGGSSGDVTPRPMDVDGGLREGEPGDSRPDLTESIGSRIGAAVRTAAAWGEPAPFSLGVAHQMWRPADSGLRSPILGLAMCGGGVDGPSGLWPRVEAGINAPLYRRRARLAYDLDHAQGPKLPLLAGLTSLPIPTELLRALFPHQVPLHVVRVGDHAFATVPGEPTTMAGWRIEQEVERAAGAASASVIGFAGDYAGYWVTPEEFLEQRYEAASTLFGRRATAELTSRLAQLGARLADR